MQNNMNNLVRLIATLQAHEQVLQAEGIAHLSVFGSAAREEDRPGSDVDICVELREEDRPRGYAMIGHVEALRERLRSIVGRPVDLVVSPVYKARLREHIERDGVRAF